MTIEERAKEYAGKTGFREGGYYWQRRFDAYIEGATEQKAIDDAILYECVKEIDQATTDHLNGMAVLIEKEMIEKACELFRKECQEANKIIQSVCDRNIGDLINVDASVKTFRKKLEE